MKQLYRGMQDADKSFLLVGNDDEVTEIREELSGQGLTPCIRSISPDVLPDTLQEMANVAAVCCVPGAINRVDLLSIYRFCQENKIPLFFCTPGLGVLQRNMRVRNVGFLSLLSPVEEPLSHWWNRMVKRVFDLLVSGVFLLLFFPFIYIAAAVVIKRKSPGAVFAMLKETDKRGKLFNQLTFRTDDLPAESFFRKPAVKKLPQFLNVFAGSMSIVPGMVKCRFCKNADVWYRQNWSLWLDMKILLKELLNRNKIKE